MPINYDIPESKKVRVIIDTDAACEADDPFSIVHALLSRKLIVKGIMAEHFAEEGSVQKSFGVIKKILELMSLDVPVFLGEEAALKTLDESRISEASQFLIQEASRKDEKPLFVLCIGALTNIASALRKSPEIASKMTIVWIGGHSLEEKNPNHREFNSGNDVDAVNRVYSSNAEIWQIPNNVYGTMQIGIAEIQNRISVCGEIGRYLFQNLVEYNNSPRAGWTSGESWSLGDSPAVGVVLEPNCGQFEYREAPVLLPDTSYLFENRRPRIRVYKSINSRFIIEDFISKLQLSF